MAETNTGTIELLALQVAQPLLALKERFVSGDTRTIFAEMGVQFPPDLEAHPGFNTSLQTLITTLAQLPEQVSALVKAIEDEDFGEIASGVANVLLSIKNGIEGFTTVSSALNTYANTKAGAEKILFQQFALDLPEKLLAFAFISFIDETIPVITKMLEFFGIVEQTEKNVGSVDPLKPPYTERVFHFDKLGSLLTSPGELLKNLYGWGNDSFNETLLLNRIGKILSTANIPVLLDSVSNPPVLDMVLVEIKPERLTGKPDGISLNLAETFSQTTSVNGDGWTLEISTSVNAPTNTKLIIEPNGNLDFNFPSLTSVNGDIFLKWSVVSPAPDQPFIIIGKAGESRWEFGKLSIGAGTSFSWNSSTNSAKGEFRTEASIEKCKIVINSGGSDGLLSSVLPLNSEAEFDLKMGVSSETGFYIQGSAAFEISLPLHITLGPIEIESLIIALKFKDGKIPVELGANIKFMLGPIQAVVQNMGLTATFSFPPDKGNLGPLDLQLGFKPPNGIGLSIDTGVIKGGGFLYLDFDKGEYMGALELEFQNLFSLKAIGIINTKMPDGSPGFSLLIIITAEFTPIQLGFGFTLNGVGGLLGLNRTTKIDVLREGVKTNALKSILFPEDIVANINRIVSDLKQVFPIQEGHFIIGPMAKIGWASVVTLELGLLIELPEPRIVILGVLKVVLPAEDADILRLQVNFLGVIDFENKYISFDASLYDSRLLIFTLTGDMALRISWGNPAVFILSVGGFHPAFNEAPPDLQNMARLSISLLSGNNPRITIECYFAVTSNTVQFGAKAELYAAACGFNVWGYIGFDVLFQFDPFRFIAEIYAGLVLRAGSEVLFSIRLRGALAGPTPWDVEGEASFSILFFDITIHFHETWGDEPGAIEAEKVNVLELLKTEFNDDRNWKADLPSNSNLFVTIKKFELPEGKIVAHPAGVLAFSEKLVPLDYTINKFGDKKPDGADKFSFSDVKSDSQDLSTNTLKELFAPANFTELSDSEKLARKSFEGMNSGFEIASSAALNIATAVDKSVEYELMYLKKKVLILGGLFKFAKDFFGTMTKGSAVSKSSVSHLNKRKSLNAPDDLAVSSEKYGIANVSNMKPHGSGLVADSQAEAYQMYNELIKSNPQLKEKVQVVSTFEMNTQ